MSTVSTSGPPVPASAAVAAVLEGQPALRGWYEDLYRHLHAHPELSMQEHATAERVVSELRAAGADDAVVTSGIAGTGVTAVLANGDGPTVLLRADMDGLPVLEDTGLDYASRATAVDRDGTTVPVMHACGHDTHVTCLLAAYRLLAQHRDAWSGTVIALFQPAEEAFNGAEAMVADGLTETLPRPDVALAQHLWPGAAGTVLLSPGPVMAACDDVRITLHGRGGHGSAPHEAIDPVVMAASLVMRLQTVVSRELPPTDTAVVTVGSLHAGTKNNIIPATAVLDLTVRTYDEGVRARALAAVERMARAEAVAAGAPEPQVEVYDSLPVTHNDPEVTARVRAALEAGLGPEQVRVMEVQAGSEDFGVVPDAFGTPYTYWGFGAFDADRWDASVEAGTTATDFPDNHSPHFAPVLQPVLDTGVTALVTAALAWLAPGR